MTTDDTALFAPVKVGALRLRNRFIRSAAFEGMTRGGEATDELIDYHREVAAGGVGMTTVAYASISPDGRTYSHQLLMRPEAVAGLRRLTDAVHREGAAAAIQLGHSGSFANAPLTGSRPIGPSVVFNTYGLTFPRRMREADIERVAGDWGRAAALAVEAGFDAIEVQACHGYLLSQFISPFTNRRDDRWGGSIENRMRLPLDVVARVRAAVGPAVPVMVKMNLSDGFDGGLGIDEAVETARLFEGGGADALVLSGGFVSKTPMYVMHGEVPFKEFYEGQTSLVKKIGIVLMGRVMIKAYPFREAYFLDLSRKVRAAVTIPLSLVGGLRTRAVMESCVAEGFELLSLARPLIMEPDFVRRLERGETDASRCEPCNKCIGVMDKGPFSCPLVEQR